MAKRDTSRRLNAIRRLARQTSPQKNEERLAKIAEIAGGGGDLDACFRTPAQPDLAERLANGQASLAPMAGQEPPEPKKAEKPEDEDEKKRKKRGTRDRQQTSGRDRGDA